MNNLKICISVSTSKTCSQKKKKNLQAIQVDDAPVSEKILKFSGKTFNRNF
jgi:hypothetical protein